MLTPSIFRFQAAGIALHPVHLIVIPVLTGLKGKNCPWLKKKPKILINFA